MNILATQNVSYLNHKHGISPNTYQTFTSLSDMYSILSIMHDKSGVPFVGIIEGKNYPIFGTQIHPEKNVYEWNEAVTNHSFDAIAITTYFANFFVAQARKNNNQFPAGELTSALIYNYPPVFINGYFETISYFN